MVVSWRARKGIPWEIIPQINNKMIARQKSTGNHFLGGNNHSLSPFLAPDNSLFPFNYLFYGCICWARRMAAEKDRRWSPIFVAAMMPIMSIKRISSALSSNANGMGRTTKCMPAASAALRATAYSTL